MPSLWGVSFDATPISGVVVEFVKTAQLFAERGHDVYLDLGYDIKSDKGAFFRPYGDEATLLPDWLRLGRIAGVEEIDGYDRDFVATVLRDVVGRGDGALLRPEVARSSREPATLVGATREGPDGEVRPRGNGP